MPSALEKLKSALKRLLDVAASDPQKAVLAAAELKYALAEFERTPPGTADVSEVQDLLQEFIDKHRNMKKRGAVQEAYSKATTVLRDLKKSKGCGKKKSKGMALPSSGPKRVVFLPVEKNGTWTREEVIYLQRDAESEETIRKGKIAMERVCKEGTCTTLVEREGDTNALIRFFKLIDREGIDTLSLQEQKLVRQFMENVFKDVLVAPPELLEILPQMPSQLDTETVFVEEIIPTLGDMMQLLQEVERDPENVQRHMSHGYLSEALNQFGLAETAREANIVAAHVALLLYCNVRFTFKPTTRGQKEVFMESKGFFSTFEGEELEVFLRDDEAPEILTPEQKDIVALFAIARLIDGDPRLLEHVVKRHPEFWPREAGAWGELMQAVDERVPPRVANERGLGLAYMYFFCHTDEAKRVNLEDLMEALPRDLFDDRMFLKRKFEVKTKFSEVIDVSQFHGYHFLGSLKWLYGDEMLSVVRPEFSAKMFLDVPIHEKLTSPFHLRRYAEFDCYYGNITSFPEESFYKTQEFTTAFLEMAILGDNEDIVMEELNRTDRWPHVKSMFKFAKAIGNWEMVEFILSNAPTDFLTGSDFPASDFTKPVVFDVVIKTLLERWTHEKGEKMLLQTLKMLQTRRNNYHAVNSLMMTVAMRPRPKDEFVRKSFIWEGAKVAKDPQVFYKFLRHLEPTLPKQEILGLLDEKTQPEVFKFIKENW